jgi:hypothetical protein
MLFERLEPVPLGPRDLAPLLHALEEYGGTIALAPEGRPTAGSIYVAFPEDEYGDKQCRVILHEWQLAGRPPEASPRGSPGHP